MTDIVDACIAAMMAMGRDGANADLQHPMRQAWEQCRAALHTRMPGQMPDGMRTYIEGMSVSVDVSTDESTAGRRYFGVVSEVMDDEADKHLVTLLVQHASPNF